MKETPYVSEESIQQAKEIEQLFTSLPSDSGVLFVGVEPGRVVSGNSNLFSVTLGVRKSMEVGTGMALARQILNQKYKGKFQFTFWVARGINCLG